MGKVRAEITMSVDGYSAGREVSLEHPLGIGGERLHDWLMLSGSDSGTEADRQAASGFFENVGAFLIGRRTFDVGIDLWGTDGTFGRPCFVPTHRPMPMLRKERTTFTFVVEGIERSLDLARAA